MDNPNLQTATLASGCFWCTEAIFKDVKGVTEVTSGYIGGSTENPSYEEVTSGMTGHAEAVQFKFDPNVISFKDILRIFFATHDPTTLNRQGNDIGTQYRSEIFFHNDDQKLIAYELIDELNNRRLFENQIVTKVSPYSKFYKAENYHQDYYRNNPQNPYCSIVISPKVTKFRKELAQFLK